MGVFDAIKRMGAGLHDIFDLRERAGEEYEGAGKPENPSDHRVERLVPRYPDAGYQPHGSGQPPGDPPNVGSAAHRPRVAR